jgi:acetyl-CoA acetyltransferase family protein
MPAAFLCDGTRTPIGRYNGSLARVRTDDLAALPIRALLASHGQLDPKGVDEVILGCANQSGEDNRNVARMAALLAGLPDSVPGVTVNRLCASGLDAVGQAARAINCGQADLILAGGVESMTRAPFVMAKADAAFSRTAKIEDTTIGWRFINSAMVKAYGVDSMPETGENVAADYQISRLDQDKFGLRSQQRVSAAQARGFFAGEITPVSIPGAKTHPTIVDRDEHPVQTQRLRL